MSSINQMRSELKRTGNPFHKMRFVRTEYYTKIRLSIDSEVLELIFKVDTGAPYTLIGLDNKELDIEFRHKMLSLSINTSVDDASGNTINIISYNVDDFILTEDIKFDRLKIGFSKELGKKNILGMDILSLFNFQYLQDNSNKLGCFYINNYQNSLSRLSSQLKNRKDEYCIPSSLLELNTSKGNNYVKDEMSANLAAAFHDIVNK